MAPRRHHHRPDRRAHPGRRPDPDLARLGHHGRGRLRRVHHHALDRRRAGAQRRFGGREFGGRGRREFDGELRAARDAGHVDAAAVGSGDRRRDGEAEAGAALLAAGAGAGGVGAGEAFEDRGEEGRGDAGAVVAYPDDDGPGGGGLDARRDRRTDRCVHPCVGQQVGQHLVQAGLVADDQGRGVQGELELPLVAGARRARVPHRFGEQRREVDLGGLQWPALVEPGEQQEVLDEAGHAGRFGGDPAPGEAGFDAVGAAVHQLGVARDGGERGAEFMAGVGEEAAHAFLAAAHLLLAALSFGEGGLDVVDHAVERGADLAGLAAGVGVPFGHPGEGGDLAAPEGGAGDLDGGGGDAAQRP